jgi:hypothetical protein
MNSRRKQRQEIPEVPYDGVWKRDIDNSLREVVKWIAYSDVSIELKSLAEEVIHRIEVFTEKFFSIVSNLEGIHLESFVEACKNRSEDLISMLNRLSLIGDTVDLVIMRGENGSDVTNLHYVSGQSTIFALGEDEDDVYNVYTIHCNPRCYSTLFVGVIKVMQEALHLQHVDRTEYKFCLYLAEIMISLSKIYLEFRSNLPLIIKREESIFEQLQSNHTLDDTSEIYYLFKEVCNDIKDGSLPYVQEIADAIRSSREFLQSPFSEKDYYYSAKATSARIKGKPRQCSLISSSFEVDPFVGHEFDECVGYVSHYNKEAPENYVDPLIRTISINQHKLKRRIIHIANNAIQDRCKYIHRRALAVLKRIVSDCTTRQEGGVIFARRVTSPQFREKNNYPGVLCMDFSNATDTLNQRFQCECIQLLFEDRIVKFWKDISTLEKTFEFKERPSKRYRQTTGQPQGLLGSFDCFAFSHHIIMLMTMAWSGLKKYKASRFYRVLGDDSIISTIISDPDSIVQENYEAICAWANLHINLDKSHIVTYEDKSAFAEFAKVSVLNGEILSPPPIRILSRVSTGSTNYYSFSTAIWMLKHGYSIPGLLDNLIQEWYGSDPTTKRIAEVLMFGGIIPQFKEFRKIDFVSRLEKGQITLSYLITKIKGTFVECFLGDKEREDLGFTNYKVSDAFASLLPRDPESVLDIIEDPEHKLLKAIEHNIIIEDALKSILGISHPKLLLPLLDLTTEEIQAILSIAEYIELAKLNLLDEDSVSGIFDIAKSLETLDRFQMRSLHKHLAKEMSYLDDAIRTHLILFEGEEELTQFE